MKGTVIDIKKSVVTVIYKSDIQISLKNMSPPIALGQEIYFSEDNVISGPLEKLKYSLKSISEKITLQKKCRFDNEIYTELILDGATSLKFFLNSKGNICKIKALNKTSEEICRKLKVLEGQSMDKAFLYLIDRAEKKGIKPHTTKAAITLIILKSNEISILLEKRVTKLIIDLNKIYKVQASLFKFKKEEHKTKDISFVRHWIWKNILKQECIDIESVRESSFTDLTQGFEDFKLVPGFKRVV